MFGIRNRGGGGGGGVRRGRGSIEGGGCVCVYHGLPSTVDVAKILILGGIFFLRL